MGGLDGSFRGILAMNELHTPVLIGVMATAEGGQVGQLAKQAGNGGEGGFLDVLHGRLKTH